MKLGLEQPRNSETSEKREDSKIDRSMILSWLQDDVQWLRHKARCDHPDHSMIRVQLLRASIYVCSVMLQALKDHEIDELMKEIEEIKKKVGLKT